MSGWVRPRNLAILGGLIVVPFFIPTRDSHATYLKPNPFETQGTKNIADRWSAGGGSDVHTPGAATPRGQPDKTLEPQVNPKGIRSDHFKENVAEQRPGDAGPFDKAWNKSHYGTEKGK